MKKLLKGSELVLGVVHQEGDRGFWLRPVEKKERRELPISEIGRAEPGDLVLAEKVGRPPRLTARVSEVLGDPFAPRSFSLIAIHKHGIPHEFPERVLEEAERVAGLALGEREDLTHVPIVAIDPADARDHDDAVWAAPDEDPANAGGWRAIVAIADVSFYVRPGSALDKEARKRGNSVYFPDRVVPMLPETLSAHVCSLKEGEDRAALVCHLQVSKEGQLKSWRFTRARVRIAANIAYEDAQAAIDAAQSRLPQAGREDRIEVASSPCSMPEIKAGEPPVPPELVESTLSRSGPAGARCTRRARSARRSTSISRAPRRARREGPHHVGGAARAARRPQAHRGLYDRRQCRAARRWRRRRRRSCTATTSRRAREARCAQGLSQDVRDRVRLGPGRPPGDLQPHHRAGRRGDFRPQVDGADPAQPDPGLLSPGESRPFRPRSGSYAHFTSPIRRYADLVVHRSLVRAWGLGPAVRETGLGDGEAEAMEVTGELISQLERRAMEAERDTLDRYVAAYLSERVGDLVDCRISGVQPFGFFATVEGLGGDGLVPVSTLGSDYFRYDEASQTLVGDDTAETFSLGQRLKLRLVEANPVSGGLRFELPDASYGAAGQRRQVRRDGAGRREDGKPKRVQGRRGRPSNIRHKGR
jgi:ribonuclease R